jgi:AcrR family transcriptional regulator
MTLDSDAIQARTTIDAIRRVELIEATLRTISDKGFERATVRDIAEAAGAAVGSVNYYFNGKHDLLLAAVAQSDARFRQRVREVVEQTDGHAEKLECMIELCFSDDSREGVDWAVFVDFWAQASRNDSFRTIFEDANSEWIDLLSTILAEGAQAGTLRFTPPAMDVALALAALIDGLALHTRVTKHVDSATAQRVAKDYVDGLRAPPKVRRSRSSKGAAA